jgi:transcriptional regulator GlxA family with amidase domain
VIRRLLDAITAEPAGDHSAEALADRAGVSVRHLSRLFHQEAETTPARFVEKVRVEAAQLLLEATKDPLDVIARQVGLGSPETLRRAFARVAGIAPGSYRARFRTSGVTSNSAKAS